MSIIFHTVSLLVNALAPTAHKLRKKNIFGRVTSHECTVSFTSWSLTASYSVSEWTKQEGVRRGQVRTAWKMLQYLKVQLAEGFNNVGGSERTGIVIQQSSALGYRMISAPDKPSTHKYRIYAHCSLLLNEREAVILVPLQRHN
jgi:hypothetical protein